MSDGHPSALAHVGVWGVLLALLALTIAFAYVDLGGYGWIAHYAIAIAMTALVLHRFMHLRTSHWLTTVFALAGFFWLSFLIILSLMDYLTRA